jgi:hypothetical protein
MNSNKVQSQDVKQVYTTMPATKVTVESDVTQNNTVKTNVPIVPNDRDIPMFLEDHVDEQYNFSNNTSLKST